MAPFSADQALRFGGYDASNSNRETWLATGFYRGIWYRVYLPLVAK